MADSKATSKLKEASETKSSKEANIAKPPLPVNADLQRDNSNKDDLPPPPNVPSDETKTKDNNEEDIELGKGGNRGNLVCTLGRLYNNHVDNSAVIVDHENGEITLTNKDKDEDPVSWMLDSVSETDSKNSTLTHTQDWEKFKEYFDDRISKNLPHINVTTIGCEGSGKANYLWGEHDWENRGIVYRYLEYILDKNCQFHSDFLQFKMYIVSDEDIIDVLDNNRTYSYQGLLGHSNLFGSACFNVKTLFLYNIEQAISLLMMSFKCMAFALKSFDRPFNPAHIVTEFTMFSTKMNNVTSIRFIDVGHADTVTMQAPPLSDRLSGLGRAHRSMIKLTGVLDMMKKAFKKKKKSKKEVKVLNPLDSILGRKPTEVKDHSDKILYDSIVNECCGSVLTYLLQDAFYMSPDCYVIICIRNNIEYFEDNKHYLDFANDLDVVSEMSAERNLDGNTDHGKKNLKSFLKLLESELLQSVKSYEFEVKKERDDFIVASENAFNRKNRELNPNLLPPNGEPAKKKVANVLGIKRSEVEKEVDKLFAQLELMQKVALVQPMKVDLNTFPLTYHCPIKKSSYYANKAIYLYKQTLFLQLLLTKRYYMIEEVFNYCFRLEGEATKEILERLSFNNALYGAYQGLCKATSIEMVCSVDELHIPADIPEESPSKSKKKDKLGREERLEHPIRGYKVSVYENMLQFLESRCLLENRLVMSDFIAKFYLFDTKVPFPNHFLKGKWKAAIGSVVKKDQVVGICIKNEPEVEVEIEDEVDEKIEIKAPKDGILIAHHTNLGLRIRDGEEADIDPYIIVNSSEIDINALAASNNCDRVKIAELYRKLNTYEGPHLLFVSNRDISDYIHTIPLYRGTTSFVKTQQDTLRKNLTTFPESIKMAQFASIVKSGIDEDTGELESSKICEDIAAISSKVWLFSETISTTQLKEEEKWNKDYDASIARLEEIGYIPPDIERTEAKNLISISKDGYFEVSVEALGLEPIHCTIVQKFNKVFVHPSPTKSRDMSLAEVYVNGARLTDECQCSDKDVIRLGKTLYFIVRIPSQAQAFNPSLAFNPKGGVSSSSSTSKKEESNVTQSNLMFVKGLWDAYSHWEFALVANFISKIHESFFTAERNRRMDLHFKVNRHVTLVTVSADKDEIQKMENYDPSQEFISLLIHSIGPILIYQCAQLASAVDMASIISKVLARGVTYDFNLKIINDSVDKESFANNCIEISEDKFTNPEFKDVVNNKLDGNSRKYAFLVHATVHPDFGGGEWFWNPNIFIDRFNLFHEMLTCFVSSWCTRDLSILDRMYPTKFDPFVDTLNEELIGASFLYLDSLQYLLDVDETLPIISFKGEEAGTLKVRVRCWIDKVEISPPYISADKECHLKHFVGKTCIVRFYFSQLFGIPDKFCCTPFLKFNYYHYPAPFLTGKYNGNNVNPYINSAILIETKVTNDFINFISTGSVEIEVKGRKRMPINEKITLTPLDHLKLNIYPAELNRVKVDFFAKILGERGVFTKEFFPYPEIHVGEPLKPKIEEIVKDVENGVSDQDFLLDKFLEQEKKEEAMQEEIQDLQSDLNKTEKELNKMKKLLKAVEEDKQISINKLKAEKEKELEVAIQKLKGANAEFVSKVKASIPRKKTLFASAKTYAECDDSTFLKELEESSKSAGGCILS